MSRWTAADDEFVIDRQSWTDAEIAQAVGRTPQAVAWRRSVLRRQGRIPQVSGRPAWYVQAYRPRICENDMCGAEYVPTNSKQRFCPPCGKQREWERHQRHQLVYDRGKGKARRYDTCPSCGGPKMRLSACCASCRDASRRLPRRRCAAADCDVLVTGQSELCRKHAARRAAALRDKKEWRRARWGKGGWDTRKKKNSHREKLSRPRGSDQGKRAWQTRRQSPTWELTRAKHLLAHVALRRQLDEDRLCVLWPGHTIKEISRELGASYRTVQINLAVLSERGLISPPVPYPPRAPTLKEVEEARYAVEEAERQAEDFRTAGLTDEGREAGHRSQHSSALRRYRESIAEVLRRGRAPTFTEILNASRRLSQEHGRDVWGKPLGEHTLSRLMKDEPPTAPVVSGEI